MSFHFQLQHHDLLHTVTLNIRVLRMRYDREEKWLTHFPSSTDPSTLAMRTQRRESQLQSGHSGERH